MDRAEATVTVTNAVGLHARPAALFVRKAKEFQSAITIENLTRGGSAVDAKSPLQVIKAAVAKDHEVKIIAEGEDASAALTALMDLVESTLA